MEEKLTWDRNTTQVVKKAQQKLKNLKEDSLCRM